MLAAGRLRQRVELQRLAVVKDERGQDVATWQTIGKPWAQVEMVGGTEAVQALQTTSKTQWKVSIRWRPDLTTRDRVLFDDGFKVHTLAIVAAVDKYQRREELELTCTESE